MKNKLFYTSHQLTICIAFALLLTLNLGKAQSLYQPYSFQYDQNFNQYLYSLSNKEHSALKPFLLDDTITINHYDSLLRAIGPNTYKSHQSNFFNRHLIDVKKKSSSFYADLMPDIDGGVNLNGSKNPGLTSIGLQLGGTVSNKFSYNITAFENSEVFPDYINTYITQTGIIPGQALANSNGYKSYNWAYVTALASYTPNKYLNVSIGRDKNFIGDGYRSLLLSDYASPYLFFKLTGTLGSVKYMSMWTYMNDPASTSPYHINRNKFGVFHYLDWNATNRLSLGVFENIIGYYKDDNGAKRPFDFYYLNPIIIMKPINNSSADPDKSLIGLTGKYKLSSRVTAYFQFALNEFNSKDLFPNDGSYTNKYGYQFGIRGNTLFNVNGLNYLLESNNVRPYTYSARSAIENYSENGEPLAHPWGGNFRELVGHLNYIHNKWSFSLETDYGKYGLDSNSLNYGKNIFNIYTDHAKNYGNTIGQGLETTMIYVDARINYLLNPLYNLRVEMGITVRDEKNAAFDDKTCLVTFGLRSTFRNAYRDLVSFKKH